MELASLRRGFMNRAGILSTAIARDLDSALGKIGRQRIRKVLGIEPIVLTITHPSGTDAVQQCSDSQDRLVALHVDSEELLCRSIEVPKAVADHLDAVLPLNLGNWTPFTEADVLAVARRIDRPYAKSDAATVQVELRCALRSLIDEKIARLTTEPDSIHLGGPEFEVRSNTPKRRRLNRRLLVMGALFAAALVQVACVAVSSAVQQDDVIAKLENRRSELTRALRRNLEHFRFRRTHSLNWRCIVCIPRV